MTSNIKYVGMDVHKASISIAVRNAAGKIVMECVIETKANTILQFVDGLRGDVQITFEEGTWAAWLHDLLKPHVTRVVVCDPRRNALLQDGNQNDRVDARKLSDLLYMNKLNPVYHGDHGLRTLKELVRSYLTITRDLGRVMTRVKAIYRSWAIPCSGKQVYGSRHRAEWLGKINEPGVRQRAEFYYQQLDALRALRQTVRRELLTESKKHKVWKRLCQIPSIGPIRAAVLLGILQTPHRFRTKRQLWTYSGLGIEVHSSADHEMEKGELRRKKKPFEIRGLNENCNHDLKNLFKGAAVVASTKPGPFESFYAALVTKGMRPEMARLTLARKIATIVFDCVEERSVLRRQSSETTNSLSVLDRVRSILGIFSGGGLWVLETPWFESESQPVS
jgi:transposase